ncbi:MAG: hypothetical protein WCH34_15040 [Bacteroidota bacterium]
MKKCILLIFGLSLFLSVSAQKVDVNDLPNGVTKVFKTSFPDAFNAFWQKTDTSYISDFTFNETKGKAFFSLNGDLLNTEWSVPPQYLPKKIKDLIAEKYKGYKVKQSDIVKKATDTESKYRVIITQKKAVETLIFNLKGEPFVTGEPKIQ